MYIYYICVCLLRISFMYYIHLLCIGKGENIYTYREGETDANETIKFSQKTMQLTLLLGLSYRKTVKPIFGGKHTPLDDALVPPMKGGPFPKWATGFQRDAEIRAKDEQGFCVSPYQVKYTLALKVIHNDMDMEQIIFLHAIPSEMLEQYLNYFGIMTLSLLDLD